MEHYFLDMGINIETANILMLFTRQAGITDMGVSTLDLDFGDKKMSLFVPDNEHFVLNTSKYSWYYYAKLSGMDNVSVINEEDRIISIRLGGTELKLRDLFSPLNQ